ncbi:MAG: transposase [Deltaproteobacteria bacterium]|nr:transposase [Deltaproteobacteria bacterium]MBW2133509.1 transposase [Deltaproteobacteria bacterium]
MKEKRQTPEGKLDKNGKPKKYSRDLESDWNANYLPYCTVFSRHTKQPIEKVYADKAYFGEPNRSFLAGNKIQGGIMRKDTTTSKLTPYEEERNKQISKIQYIVEQCFGLSHLSDHANRARFPQIPKNNFDCWCRQVYPVKFRRTI